MQDYSELIIRTLQPGAQYWANHSGTGAEYTIRYQFPDAPDEYVTARLSYSVERGVWLLGIIGRSGDFLNGTELSREVAARLEDTLSDMGSYYAVNERTIRAFYAGDYPLHEHEPVIRHNSETGATREACATCDETLRHI